MNDYPEFVPPRLSTYSLPNSSPGDPKVNDVDVSGPKTLERGLRSRTGLSKRAFWGFIVISVAAIAAAVGGGVGGALAVQRAKSGSQQSSESSPQPDQMTNTAATVTVTVVSSNGIPSNVLTSIASASASALSEILKPERITSVDVSCPEATMIAWNGDQMDCLEKTQVEPGSGDITGIIAYTLQDCINACITLNEFENRDLCKTVSMEWDLSFAYKAFKGANCFLRAVVSPTSKNANVTSLILSGQRKSGG